MCPALPLKVANPLTRGRYDRVNRLSSFEHADDFTLRMASTIDTELMIVLEMLPGVGLTKLPSHWVAKLPMTCLTMIILNILDLISSCISRQRK